MHYIILQVGSWLVLTVFYMNYHLMDSDVVNYDLNIQQAVFSEKRGLGLPLSLL
jgi:hypothetical protein